MERPRRSHRRASAAETSPGALEDAPPSPTRALWATTALLAVYGAALLGVASAHGPARALVAGPSLAAHTVAVLAVGIAGLVAAVGLARRISWGWWVAAVLAQFHLWRAGWEAIASDVATDAGAAQGNRLLLSAVLRLALFVAAAVALHSYPVARLFHLSWSREEERSRTHRVIYYGAGLFLALHLSGRLFGSGPSTRGAP